MPRIFQHLDISLVELHRILDFAVEKDCGHSTPCWVHQGQLDKDGYARVKIRGKTRRAARLLLHMLNGPLSPELEPDHLCRVRACVNPRHLEAVTHAENVRRSQEHLKKLKAAKRAEQDAITNKLCLAILGEAPANA